MRRSAGFAAVLCMLLCACGGVQAPELMEPVEVQIQTTKVVRGNVMDISVYEGVTRPVTVPCGFEGEGTVEEVFVNRGDWVEKGDVLAALNCDMLNAEIAEAEAALERLALEQEVAEQRYALQRELTAGDAQSRLLENQYLQQEQERSAELEELQDRIERMESSVSSAELRAPCRGRVLQVSVLPGSMVREGDQAVFLSDESQLEVVTEFLGDETVEHAVEIYATLSGERYALTYMPYDRETYFSLMMAGEEMESSFRLDEPEHAASGMYALVYIVAEEADNVLYLPSTAVFHDAEGAYVYLWDGTTQIKTTIETGIETEAQIEILEGVKEGDVVYVS